MVKLLEGIADEELVKELSFVRVAINNLYLINPKSNKNIKELPESSGCYSSGCHSCDSCDCYACHGCDCVGCYS